ncbi:MAG: crossover junction endodeoxyribonuclease RuvC [Candidatus Eisenbacteria bacterium]|nr:crossover junction endodeoxyribonuclease RuvC [Candidatus Eisenbacteria bacterium]MBU1947879.1 crossover junction endodeoxyribonuclease RuvC [Candidatus Eisenbacteria bacterium]
MPYSFKSNKPMNLTILGIDPGTKEMGVAVLRGQQLLGSGVHTLRNGGRPRDVIDQARQIILSYIQEFTPSIVGIEKPLLVPTKRAALVSVIAQELHARAREVGMKVIEISPRDARRIVVGNPHAKKIDVARAISGMKIEGLHVDAPKAPPHPVLGYRPKDKYWLHLFDALAVAIAVGRIAR